MNANRERPAAAWFEEAARWYLEGHQGCAGCGRQHCVFRSEWGPRVEYHCSVCDFFVCHDRQSGAFFTSPGREDPLPETLLGCADLCAVDPRD